MTRLRLSVRASTTIREAYLIIAVQITRELHRIMVVHLVRVAHPCFGSVEIVYEGFHYESGAPDDSTTANESTHLCRGSAETIPMIALEGMTHESRRAGTTAVHVIREPQFGCGSVEIACQRFHNTSGKST